MSAIPVFMDNVYNIPHWDIKGKVARTNLPACTYMRGPGKLPPEAIYLPLCPSYSFGADKICGQ